MTIPAGHPAFAANVEGRLSDFLHEGESGPGLLEKASRHLVLAPGAKRLRPLMVHLVGDTLGVEPEVLVDLAAASEGIHAASLLHDDVVDAGTTRRGTPTSNAVWGNDVAVLAGDFALSRSLRALQRYPLALTVYAIQLVEEMTRGAIAEVNARGKLDLPLSGWRYIAEAKAGALFGFCCRATALIGGRAEIAPTLDRFGRQIGVAFQLADDLKDVLDPDLGKDRYADLKNRNPSSLSSTLYERGGETRRVLEACWHGDISAQEAGDRLVARPEMNEMLGTLSTEIDRSLSLWIDTAKLPADRVADLRPLLWGRLPELRRS